LEALKFWKKRKRFDKISWKWKRTRKRPTLYGAGSGSKKSQEWGSESKLGSMTLQEEPEAEVKSILLLPHPCTQQTASSRLKLLAVHIHQFQRRNPTL